MSDYRQSQNLTLSGSRQTGGDTTCYKTASCPPSCFSRPGRKPEQKTEYLLVLLSVLAQSDRNSRCRLNREGF
jgi:hypothetical protein